MPSISSIFVKRSPDSARSFLPDSQATAMSTLQMERKPGVAAAGPRLGSLKHIDQTGWLFHYITPLCPKLQTAIESTFALACSNARDVHTHTYPNSTQKAASPNASCSFAVASSAANRFQSMKRDLFEQCAYVYLH